MNELPSASTPGLNAVRHYLDALDVGQIDDLMACFSDEVLYVHPGSGPGAERMVMRGAAELRKYFIARGQKPWTHRIDACAFAEGQYLLHGSVISEAGEEVGSYMVCAALDVDGKITSYRAYAG